LCTDGGFLRDDKAAIEEYKERTKSGWDLRYDKFWDDKGGMD